MRTITFLFGTVVVVTVRAEMIVLSTAGRYVQPSRAILVTKMPGDRFTLKIPRYIDQSLQGALTDLLDCFFSVYSGTLRNGDKY